jgi:hypothetical protein
MPASVDQIDGSLPILEANLVSILNASFKWRKLSHRRQSTKFASPTCRTIAKLRSRLLDNESRMVILSAPSQA